MVRLRMVGDSRIHFRVDRPILTKDRNFLL